MWNQMFEVSVDEFLQHKFAVAPFVSRPGVQHRTPERLAAYLSSQCEPGQHHMPTVLELNGAGQRGKLALTRCQSREP